MVAAFEVEISTSIYSAILRLTDLAFSIPENETALNLVVPAAREKEVQAQLLRPAIRATGGTIHCIPSSELRSTAKHCESSATRRRPCARLRVRWYRVRKR